MTPNAKTLCGRQARSLGRGAVMPARSNGLLDGLMVGRPQVGEELCLDEPQGVSVPVLGVPERSPKTEGPSPAERPHDDCQWIELTAATEEVKDGRRQGPPPPAAPLRPVQDHRAAGQPRQDVVLDV